MSYNTDPFYKTSEAARAIVHRSPVDFQLAHGVSLVEDPNKFQLLTGDFAYTRELREVSGVTVVSLSPRGEVSYRSAVFGVDDPYVVDRVDTIGAEQIEVNKESARKSPLTKAATTHPAYLKDVFFDLEEDIFCTLGGVITFMKDDGSGIAQSHQFISEKLSAHLDEVYDSPMGKAGAFLGRLATKLKLVEKPSPIDSPESPLVRKAGNYVLMMSAAVKRGAPIVVDQPLFVRV